MIEKAFVISFIVMFVWSTMLDGMIFGFIRTKVFVALTDYWKKPLFDCPICMAGGGWGSIVYWSIVYAGKWKGDWIEWIICICMAGGICTVFAKIFPHDIQKMFLSDKPQ